MAKRLTRRKHGQRFLLPVVIERDRDGYYAECPVLQGCYTQGDTYDEVIANIKDAIKLDIQDRLKNSILDEKERETMPVGTIPIKTDLGRWPEDEDQFPGEDIAVLDGRIVAHSGDFEDRMAFYRYLQEEFGAFWSRLEIIDVLEEGLHVI